MKLYKKVNAFKAKDLIAALNYLFGRNENDKTPHWISKMKSDGVTFAIIRRFQNLLDHRCDSCSNVVPKNRLQVEIDSPCVGCGTKACEQCYNQGGTDKSSFVCPSCKARLSRLNKIPDAYMRQETRLKKGIRKMRMNLIIMSPGLVLYLENLKLI